MFHEEGFFVSSIMVFLRRLLLCLWKSVVILLGVGLDPLYFQTSEELSAQSRQADNSVFVHNEESTEVKTSLSEYNEGSVVLLHLTLSAQQQ